MGMCHGTPPCHTQGPGQPTGVMKLICVSGQFLREVDPGQPAQKAGMQDGDRLVAVAGDSVEGLSHEETVSQILAQGSRLSLTVVDQEADRFFSMVRAKARDWNSGAGLVAKEAAASFFFCPHPGPPVPSPFRGTHAATCLSGRRVTGRDRGPDQEKCPGAKVDTPVYLATRAWRWLWTLALLCHQ